MTVQPGNIPILQTVLLSIYNRPQGSRNRELGVADQFTSHIDQVVFFLVESAEKVAMIEISSISFSPKVVSFWTNMCT